MVATMLVGKSMKGTGRSSEAEENLDADLRTYRAMLLARRVDEAELQCVGNRQAFFHVSGAGHEATAVLADLLRPSDWLHLHYRDKALMLARGIHPAMFLHSLLCNAESHSAGRQMSAHMSDPALHILSLVGPVGNNALQAVGVAAEVSESSDSPIVVCSVGDGTSQQGEFLEAVAEAVREELPVLFLVEDNAYAISTETSRKTWYSLPGRETDEFYGLPIHRIDGRSPEPCREPLQRCVAELRSGRGPALVVMSVDRLSSHTNADDEQVYRSHDELGRIREEGDPLVNSRRYLLASGVAEETLDALERETAAAVEDARQSALRGTAPSSDVTADDTASDKPEARGNGEPVATMSQAMRDVLRHHLGSDPRVSLFGQDIEDPKGDVFGVTKGLSTEFKGRVLNAPLSEATIVGKAIGRALAGGRPVACIQFADFLPLAFNQIISELGSMAWRTRGEWTCPVIIMAPCGGYRPGLGPFHAQTMESVLSHVPGIQVLMPSNATDAAGLLNAAFESQQPTVFLYPKVCLNDRERTTSADVHAQFVPLGRSRHLRRGDDVTIVTYGATTYQCIEAAEALQEHGIGVDLIDLRSVKPWDKPAVLESAKRTGRLIVVHEDNGPCSVASEILATVTEQTPSPIQVRRVTRPDTYIPCDFGSQLQVLPSFKRVLETAGELLGIEVDWLSETDPEGSVIEIEAQGGSPADQAVTIIEWRVQPGDTVRDGQVLVELEADKAVFEYSCPYDATVEELLVEPGIEISVGTPILRLRVNDTQSLRQVIIREEPGKPLLSGPKASAKPTRHAVAGSPVAMSKPVSVEGERVVTNEQLAADFPERTAEDISRLTGIRSRRWVGPKQTALTLAAEACHVALRRESLKITDIDALVVSTTTPLGVTPSMACMVLGELSAGDHEIPAHDVSAACTGYLYALAAGYDFIQCHPDARVLVVTTEVLSPLLDPTDFDTAILFADAATATILGRPLEEGSPIGRLHRPLLFSKPDTHRALRVSFTQGEAHHHGNGNGRRHQHALMVEMDHGKRVFGQAVRAMDYALGRASRAAGYAASDLSIVVPHQANGRIIDAVSGKLGNGCRVINAIAESGNTSSSSIPLALAALPTSDASSIGLCAFGGGFTYGAAIIEKAPTDAGASGCRSAVR
jgi:2-oxoisovalerate dehydrogenase E1 component